MRIKFLGTGASEAIPAMFCRCRICENARKVGGKEMRTRAGVLINDDLMVDFSPDAYWHARNYGLDFTKLKSIIITHGHSDHFNVEDLTNNRNHAVQAFEPDYVYLSPLKLYAEQKILDKMKKSCESNATVGSIVDHEVELWQRFETEGYAITPMPSLHCPNSMVYVIEKDEKTYLHLCDTGEIKEEVFEFLKARDVKVDAITIDSTYGLLQVEYFGHLNLNQVVKICERFKADGVMKPNAKVYLTHIGHSGECTHAELEEQASKYGLNVAYDGLTIDL